MADDVKTDASIDDMQVGMLNIGPMEVLRAGYGGLKATDMTLRDHFAGQALAGFVMVHVIANGPSWRQAEIAASSYRVADAMLAERAK